ncbi:MAG: hypothetical protein SPF89_09180 [Sphaerochaetaceae bacterium]|nr:hypothetical protein [Spirochaetales bacterium]MDY5500264.1 hypothetical protein [Sphaerochaetaceae bacterium]
MFYATNKPQKHAREELSCMLRSLSIGQTVTIATKDEQVSGPISLIQPDAGLVTIYGRTFDLDDIYDIQKEPISL